MIKKHIFFFILIVVLAGFLRFYQIGDVPFGLYPDEAMNGNNALFALENKDFKIFYQENNGREGLFINLIAFSIKFFGNNPFAIRFVSAIIGLLTVVGIYFLTRELFKNTRWENQAEFIALLSAFFLATSFWHLNFSRIGFRAIMAPFFLTWAFYFFLFIFRENLNPAKKILAVALGGISFGLGFHTYLGYRFAPLLLLIPAIFLRKIQKELPQPKNCLWCLFLLFIFFIFIAGLPIGFYFLNNPHEFFGRAGQVSIFSAGSPLKELAISAGKTIQQFWWQGDSNWRHNYAGEPELWWPVGILFAAGLFVSGRNFLKTISIKEKFVFSLLFLWLILFLLPSILSSEGLPHALRSIVVLPAVMIFASFGAVFIVNSALNFVEKNQAPTPIPLVWGQGPSRLKKEIWILVFVFLAANAVYVFNQYFVHYANQPEVYYAFNGNYLEIGNWLKALPDETQKYVIINANGAMIKTPDSSESFPTPAQTVMFATNSWSQKNQNKKNIIYLEEKDIAKISCENECVIAMLEVNSLLRDKIKNNIPKLKLSVNAGFPILYAD